MTIETDNLEDRVPGASCMEKVLALHAEDPQSDIESWIKGVKGEQETARFLGLLGPEWRILHSIPIGTSGKDIDHLVIGPTGVFVINSKNHQSAYALVSGPNIVIGKHPWSEPASALKDANQVAQILTTVVGFPVPTTGVVSLVGVKKITIGDEYPVVTVLHARGLAKMIRQSRPNQGLDVTQIKLLYSVATKATTWGSIQQHEPQYISTRYETLIAGLNPLPHVPELPTVAKLVPRSTRNRQSTRHARSRTKPPTLVQSFHGQVRRNRALADTSPKSPIITLALLFFLGFFGVHRLYVGKYKLGITSFFLLMLSSTNHTVSSIYILGAFFILFWEFLLITMNAYTDGEGRVLRFRSRKYQIQH